MRFLETSCKEQYIHGEYFLCGYFLKLARVFFVVDILKNTFKFTKSVIICDREEINDVQTFLMLKGIEFTSFSGVSQHEDILYLEKLWTNKYPGDFSGS